MTMPEKPQQVAVSIAPGGALDGAMGRPADNKVSTVAKSQLYDDHPDIGIYSIGEIFGHATATLANAALLVASLCYLGIHASAMGAQLWWAPLAIALGLLLADLISGLLHWALDTWFHAETPGLQRMVKTVREHHIYPSAVLDYKLRHHVGILSAPALLVTGPFLLWMLLSGGTPGPFRWLLGCAMVTTSICVVLMFETHKVGHRRRCSGLACVLGRCHLLLTPDHHMRHHQTPYDCNYCLVTGWADYLMDCCDGFRRLESLISGVTGAIPRDDDRRWLKEYLGAHGEEA